MLQQKYKVVLLIASLIGVWGMFPKSVKAQVVQIDGSSTVFPDHRSGRRRIPEGQKGQGQSHGRHLRHRRRFQEVLPRRDRHHRCLAPDPQGGDGSLQEARRRVLRAAGRLRRADRGREPEERLGQVPDRRRAQEDVGAGAQGKITSWNQVSPDWPNEPLKLFGAGRRFRHLRLLHRSDRRQGQVQPRRLHRQRGRQRAGAGRRQRRNALGYFGFAYYVENQNKLKAVPIDGGKGPSVRRRRP